MKRTLVALLTLLSLSVAGCGTDTQTLVVEKEKAPATAGKLEILGKNLQKLTFGLNTDGSLAGLMAGSIIIKPADVEKVIFVSWRIGYRDNSLVQAVLAADNSATLQMPNNEEGAFLVKTKDGNFFNVYLEGFKISSYKPMYYWAHEDYFEYGNLTDNTGIRLSLDNSGKINMDIQFGLDMLIGIRDLKATDNIVSFRFVTVEGATYEAPKTVDTEGNISGLLTGIMLEKISPYESRVEGNLYAVTDKGEIRKFEFNYASEDKFNWGMGSHQSDLYGTYDEQADSMTINYYVN